MKDIAREPSRIERGLAIAITSMLTAVFGSLAFLLIHLQNWLPGAIFCAAFLGTLVLLHRATFTAPRALGSRETRIVAWCLLAVGTVTALCVALIEGSITSRLMALGPALAFMAAGGAGIRKQAQHCEATPEHRAAIHAPND